MEERRSHRFSAGQGFGEPYTGFTLDTDEGESFRIDPTDDHALADLLDPANYVPEDVDAEALLSVGLSYLAIEDYGSAIDCFARVCWFAPETSRVAMEAWVNRGVAHAQLGEYDEAIGAALEALRIDTEDDGGERQGTSRFPDLAAVAESNLAYAVWESGDSSHPLEHAERAVELDPRLAEAWFDLGFYYNERALYEPAREALERATTLGLRTLSVREELSRALDGLDERAVGTERERTTEPAAEGRERLGA